MERRKIELYRVRSFGDKLNDTFAFVNENYRQLLKYLTYFLLPLSLVQAVAMNGYLGNMMTLSMGGGNGMSSDALMSMAGSMAFYALVYGVGAFLLVTVVYALMRLYNRREQRLNGLMWEEMKPEVGLMLRRGLLLVLLGIVVAVLFGLLIFALVQFSPMMLFLLLPALFVVALPLSLLTPVYLFEERISLTDALWKSLRLGFRTWGGILAVMLVMTIIASVLQGVVSIPWYIAFIVKSLFGLQQAEDSFVNSVGFSFIIYLLGVVQAFGGFLTYSLAYISLAYQYGHAAEKIDGVTVDSDIEHFEEL